MAGEWVLVGLQLRIKVWPLVKETLYKLPWHTIKLAFLIQGSILGILVSRMTRVCVCVYVFQSPTPLPYLRAVEPSHSAGTTLQFWGKGNLL